MDAKVIDQRTIRTQNRKKILYLLMKKRELTIAEISRELKISIPTVSKNIAELIAEGVAQEAGVSESTGGRRPMVIRFVPDAYYAIGVEFRLQQVRLILTNLDSVIQLDRALNNVDFTQIDALMQQIQSAITAILRERAIPAEKVLGIGISVPGTINEQTRYLKIATTLGLKNVNFTKYQALFLFPIFVENDANAAAMAELTLGIAKTMRNLIYISVLPKGIGGGIVVDGRLYRGKNKRAGELSHMKIASHGKVCSCGRTDCWEVYASANNLLNMYRQRTNRALDSLAEFFATFKSADPAAVAALDEYLTYLALGIQNIILIQDPHYVIIGGVISPFEEFFLAPLQAKVFVENEFYDTSDVQIMCSTLQEDATILGVSRLPFERIFS